MFFNKKKKIIIDNVGFIKTYQSKKLILKRKKLNNFFLKKN
jgi:hypothetical protein